MKETAMEPEQPQDFQIIGYVTVTASASVGQGTSPYPVEQGEAE